MLSYIGESLTEFPADNPYIDGLSLNEILRNIPRNDSFREAKIWLAMVEQQPETNETLIAQIKLGIEIAEKFGLYSLSKVLKSMPE